LKIFLTLAALLVSLSAAAAQPQVELTTNMGAITLELYPENAPNTVENFLRYVKNGHYDGTIFHRVIPGFMIQGGGFTREFAEKPTVAPIRNEAGNGLRNAAGFVAMARTADPHSASAQFFINLNTNSNLDFRSQTPEGWGYTVFGKVVKGMDVVNRIAGVATASRAPHDDVPVKPVIIQRARIVAAQPPTQ
jgi:cyclophilin family peptidyl-prolyl cis-trans isomerase